MQKKDFVIACQKEYTSRKLLIAEFLYRPKRVENRFPMIQRIVPLFTLFRDPQSFLLMTKHSMLVQTILFTGRKIKELHLKLLQRNRLSI